MGLAKTREILFDIRTVARYIDKGRLTRAEYEKYVASLKDMSGHAIAIPTELILGENGSELGRRKYIPAYSHRKTRDFTGVTFEDEFDDEIDQGEYGIEDDVLSTRSDDEIDD
jgi:hypothetical protein